VEMVRRRHHIETGSFRANRMIDQNFRLMGLV